uniref:Hexosyltransferase n=1 Tax=Eptatretus burgeri TaxID=7764 RepID=A0A8C4QG34_EPTBU
MGLGAGWFVWSWVIVVSGLLLGLVFTILTIISLSYLHLQVSYRSQLVAFSESWRLQQQNWTSPRNAYNSECSPLVLPSGFLDIVFMPERFRRFLEYRHCHTFPQIIDEPRKCHEPNWQQNTVLLLCVKTRPEHYKRRKVIRETWGEEVIIGSVEVRTLFLIGLPSNNEASELQKIVQAESAVYRDIVQWGFVDTFFNLTLKQVCFMRWVSSNCPEAMFIFNGDDDVFVNIKNVVKMLTFNPLSDLYLGNVFSSSQRRFIWWSKYYIPWWMYDKSTYPPYVGGAGVLMSVATVRKFYKAASFVDLYPIDDVYFGMLAKKSGVVAMPHSGFKSLGYCSWLDVLKMTPTECLVKDLMVTHQFLPEELMRLWNSLKSQSYKC